MKDVVKLKAGRAVRKVIEVSPHVSYDVRLDPPEDYCVESSDLTLNPYSLWYKEAEPFYRLVSAYSSTQYASIEGKLDRYLDGARKRLAPFGVDVPSVDIDWAGFDSEPDEHIEDTNYVFCAVPPVPLQGRPFKISVRNEKGRLSKGPVKLNWSDPTLKVCRADGSQVANGAEFELPGGAATFHAVPSETTGPFILTALGPEGETGRSADWIKGRMNPGLITETIAPAPVDRTRKIVGVGEEVRLCVAGYTGNVKWDISHGRGTINQGNELVWAAPERDCSATITARFGDKQEFAQFQVIKPTELHFRFFRGTPESRSLTPPDSRYYFFSYDAMVYISPDTVNFYQLEFFESFSAPLGVVGSFADFKLSAHRENGPHKVTSEVVRGLGTRLRDPDSIGGYTADIPFKDGAFYWAIDWTYRVGEGATMTNFLETIKQTFKFKAFSYDRGRFTISKKDSSAWIEGTSGELHSGNSK